jgi:hypothetical protein
MEDKLDNLKKGKGLSQYSDDVLKELNKTIPKAIYENAVKQKIKHSTSNDSKWTDKIECDVCGKIYTRSNSGAHKKTREHKIYENMNKKLRKIMLNS